MGIGTINNLKRERDLGHEYGIKMPRFINEKFFAYMRRSEAFLGFNQ